MFMFNAQVLYYNRQPVRVVQINGSRWWVLCDVTKILKYANTYHATRFLDSSEKQIALVNFDDSVSRVNIVNDAGLQKVIQNSSVHESVDFKQWVAYGALPPIQKNDEDLNTPPVKVNHKTNVPVKTKHKFSIEVALQKAALFVRMAEHKAIPKSEQLRLLDMALKELTDAGLDIDTPSVKHIAEKISEPIEKAPVPAKVYNSIMDLPEVVGVLNKAQHIETNIKHSYLRPVRRIVSEFGITVG